MNEERKKLKKNMIGVWLVWSLMVLFLIAYVAICHMLIIYAKYESTVSPELPFDSLRNILIAISLFEIILVYILRKFLLKPRKKSPINGKSSTPTGKYLTVILISCALADSIGIYGLVLFLVRPNFPMLYAFTAVAAIVMIAFRPKFEEFERLALGMKEFEID